MNRKLICAAISVALSGCVSERIVYRPIPVPKPLTQAVQKPLKPNPETATQQDVAVFLIEQNAAIELCNQQLNTIRDWRKKWITSTKHKY